ncbi:MAG: sigma-70 family RNA polymerase sigma factor [Myxococcales bacterium]|nr:sigma-70 family RNA polymerase sigma factor [Myxococcales bacterium]
MIESLHHRYAALLYDKCVRILADAGEAEDAVQETMLSAYSALDRFDESLGGYLPWLYRIATNVCLKQLRTRRRKGATPCDTLAERVSADATLDPDATDPRGRDPVRRLHYRRMLEQLVDRVDKRTLEIVVAHFVDGLDQSEIAKQLGISRRAVVKRLSKLRGREHAELAEALQHG